MNFSMRIKRNRFTDEEIENAFGCIGCDRKNSKEIREYYYEIARLSVPDDVSSYNYFLDENNPIFAPPELNDIGDILVCIFFHIATECTIEEVETAIKAFDRQCANEPKDVFSDYWASSKILSEYIEKYKENK